MCVCVHNLKLISKNKIYANGLFNFVPEICWKAKANPQLPLNYRNYFSVLQICIRKVSLHFKSLMYIFSNL